MSRGIWLRKRSAILTPRYEARGVVARVIRVGIVGRHVVVATTTTTAVVVAATIDAAGGAATDILQARLVALRIGVGAMFLATTTTSSPSPGPLWLVVIRLIIMVVAQIAILAGHLVAIVPLMPIGSFIIHSGVVYHARGRVVVATAAVVVVVVMLGVVVQAIGL